VQRSRILLCAHRDIVALCQSRSSRRSPQCIRVAGRRIDVYELRRRRADTVLYVLLPGSPMSLASPLDSAGNTSTQTRKGRNRLERGGRLNNGAWDEALKSRRHLESRMFTDLVRVPTLTLFGWSIRGLPHISHLKSRANAVPILFYYQVPR
jgi:hypothetical protein